jgi:uncharacterized membrane protein
VIFVNDFLGSIFRWMHVFAGIIWIGHLYFFNFVNGPFAGTMDGETKKKVVPELMPRALFWFRWAAAWTWITGVLLVGLAFYHSGITFTDEGGWGVASFAMIAVTYLAPFLYDPLAKSPLGKNLKSFAVAGIVLTAVVLWLMVHWAHFSYRSWNIHAAMMFGTIMAWNVWFRIWPAQQKIIAAVKAGQAPDPTLVALAAGRSKTNTYLSIPLLWGMLNQHTLIFAGGNFGLTAGTAWISFVAAMLIGWHVVWQCYRKAAAVKGF